MSWSSSDEIEEIFYKAHKLGLTERLRNRVSKMDQPNIKTSDMMVPLYQRALEEILNTLD
jgi:hypothetical protein